MNHTATINIWKQNNRVSRLWEELAANCVDPDPRSKEGTSPGLEQEPDPPAPDAGLGSPFAADPASFPGRWDDSENGERPFMERVGRESIHLIKHALDVLTAPPEEGPVTDSEREEVLEELPGISEEMEISGSETFPTYTGPDLFPAMIKVPFEPEPQPTSVIETRRIIYGLKIPARPLHKRPIYQRVLFCLRGWIRSISGKHHDPYS